MIFATDRTIPVHHLAPEVEDLGFESLWVTEKTHVPVSRTTPWPGGDLPDGYRRTCDPFVALSAAAAVTSTLRLGTGVALLGVRDPVIAAKEIATLDWISDGRLELGVGYGWNAEELATHHVDIHDARPVLADRLACTTAIWTHDIAEHDGPHAHLEPSWSWPKPVQQPRPPIHLGARATPEVFDDIATWGDGWLPIEGYGDITPHIPKLHDAFERHDRNPATAIVTVYSSAGEPESLDRYLDAGVDRVVLALPAGSKTDVRAVLGGHRHLLNRF